MLENENYNPENEPEGVMKFMDNLPASKVKVLNPVRYQSMLRSVFMLKDILAETEDLFDINVDIEERFNAGVVSVELEELTILSPEKFSLLLQQVDNMEVYRLINGRIRLTFTYHGVLKTIE